MPPLGSSSGDEAARAGMAKKSAKAKKPAKLRKKNLPSIGKARRRPAKTPVRKKVLRKKAAKSPKANRSAQKKSAAKAAPKRTALPAILFEGDRPSSSARAAESPSLAASAASADLTAQTELPEAYGTQQVLLTARDPHWLYAHWDLTREQLRDYNAKSVHKHLVLRVAKETDGAQEPTGEVHVHPESRHWFVHVADAGVKYTVELGYYGKNKGWTTISASAPTLAPPEVASTDSTATFSTIPADVALSELVELVRSSAAKNHSLAHALEELRLAGHPDLPAVPDGATPKAWTPAQEHALAEIIRMKQLGRMSVGSLDITELVRQELGGNFSSLIAALAGPGGISSLSSFSSPQGGVPAGPGGFWFNLNAEIIVYGATEPNASVTIGGRPVKLRPDGSFSFRFALPDGQYELPVTAVSADNTEARHADVKFSRATDYVGDVGQHPQDPALKVP